MVGVIIMVHSAEREPCSGTDIHVAHGEAGHGLLGTWMLEKS